MSRFPTARQTAALKLVSTLVLLSLYQFAHGEDQQSPQQQQQQQQRRARSGGLGGFGEGVIKARVTPHWFADNTRFWYSNILRDGAREFVLVDAGAGKREKAFDHEKLAAALTKALDQNVKPDRLPLESIEFVDDGKAIRFTVAGTDWKCDLKTYELTSANGATTADPKAASQSDTSPFRLATNRIGTLDSQPSPSDEVPDDQSQDDSSDSPQAQDNQATRRATRGPGFGRGSANRGPVQSPDKKWTAILRDSNVFLRDENGKVTQLSEDGKSDFAYTRLNWSPDSAYLIAFRMEPGDHKEVYRIESSPAGQNEAKGGGVGRAVLQTAVYALPGDKLDSYELNVFDVENKKQLKPLGDERIDMNPDGGDPNPSFVGPAPNFRWRPDGTHFLFEKFDRGHQRVRIVEVDAKSCEARNVLDEKSKTFIWSAHIEGLNLRLITYLKNEKEILYVSEKDGWRQFYLIDIETGSIKPITSGQWVVRSVNRVDEDGRQIWFTASGVYPDQDPYLVQYGRVNFDGSGLTWLTSGNGNHNLNFSETDGSFSPDGKYIIDTYSRIDLPPVTELRRIADGQFVCALEKAEVTVPWTAPEVHVAKGRDGTTDIWGIISFPRDMDPKKKYPVLEDIYAGPQGSFVPKTFSSQNRYRELNDLGFIIVKIDGMGTANRSKAFHDVCWHNLKDAGFLDRIAWMKDAAKKFPCMDLDKVGVYGTSAGGQNAAAAVLFHPEFYQVAVANCGCHDNRMDKVSWNEQWLGYPVGPQYSECSNIDNAAKLRGHLQLVVGEVDSNVPPESTFRFVNALVQARKDFELVVIPGANHGAASPITRTKLQDFFVRYLKDVEPPNHNAARGTAE